jgi:hypothetical protein
MKNNYQQLTHLMSFVLVSMLFSALKLRPNSPTDTDIGEIDFLGFRNSYKYQFIPAFSKQST